MQSYKKDKHSRINYYYFSNSKIPLTPLTSRLISYGLLP
nr:MAG TPA: hypothetical protein [Caudoviricetes sp.]